MTCLVFRNCIRSGRRDDPRARRQLPLPKTRILGGDEKALWSSRRSIQGVATMIFVPADSHRASSVEMVTIDPLDLKEAQDRDAEIPEASSATVQSQSGDDPRED